MNFDPRNQIVILVVFFLIGNSAFCSEKTLINFQSLDLAEAGIAGKKIMVSFTADWCLPCKVIKASLYNDPEIAELVNNNFQAVLADVDSSLGESWNEEYNVHYLPGIVFANSVGIEFERTKGTPSRKEFLDILRRIINTSEVPYRSHNHTVLEKSTLVQAGRDIQLGAFSTFTSAERRMNKLVAYKENNYSIIQEKTKGRLLYKVVHQGLLSQEESVSLLNQYHRNGFEAFIRPD